MTDSLYTGGTTSQGPTITANSTPSVGSEFNYGITVPQYNNIPCSNGVFSGTLSAQGNMVAMLLNPGSSTFTGVTYLDQVGWIDASGAMVTENQKPYLTGYLREYWLDPSQCRFGADTAIPALTGVMLEKYGVTGSLPYYLDLQMTRMTGSNYFDNYKFINTFNQILTWVTTSNDYIIALNKAQANNLSYYGYKSYQEYITSGFSQYKVGTALLKAISNVGAMIKEISRGHFGTPNSVARVLVSSGVGMYGDLTAKLTALGIPLDSNIYNEVYTEEITAVLKTITKKADLATIQAVLKSSIPNITDPTDYISIEKCSGLPNDSAFKDFKSFGLDLYQRAPGFSLTTGKALADSISLTISQASPALESLATATSLLPDDIIAGLRKFLPVGINGGPVTLLNVIGTPSGYLTEYLAAVNRGLDKIDKSAYGPQLRTAFGNITTNWNLYQRSGQLTNDGWAAGPDYLYQTPFDNSVLAYKNLVSTIATDPGMSSIVAEINNNYDDLCKYLSLEVLNYNKSNLRPSTTTVTDNSLIYSFISSLQGYATDAQELGTDTLIYGMCQDNDAGQIIQQFMDLCKNNQLLSSIGVRTNNTL